MYIVIGGIIERGSDRCLLKGFYVDEIYFDRCVVLYGVVYVEMIDFSGIKKGKRRMATNYPKMNSHKPKFITVFLMTLLGSLVCFLFFFHFLHFKIFYFYDYARKTIFIQQTM